MRQKMDNWQRIDSVIRWANMTINYFALYIGLPRGENLYQIKKGNNVNCTPKVGHNFWGVL